MKAPTLLPLFTLLALAGAARAEVAATVDDGRLAITIDGQPFAHYPASGTEFPVIYPIYGPGGVLMVRQYPFVEGVAGEKPDHPHHQSLWYTHGDVNGVDFWHKGGVIEPSAPFAHEVTEEGVVVTSRHRWKAKEGDRVILTDTRTAVFGRHDDGSRFIDLTIALHASEGDVTFGDTKEGTMAIRTHPALRLSGEVATGKAVNSAGDRDKDLWGKAAKWVSYWGEVDGKEVGVAIFDHPGNPRHPTTWHARDYGLVAANPFGYRHFFKGEKGSGDLRIPDGETATFRYRFVFHAGGHESAKIPAKYEVFAGSR